jgi:hypothetical protein
LGDRISCSKPPHSTAIYIALIKDMFGNMV